MLDEEDEFVRYYRQYRSGAGSRASSSEEMSDNFSNSSSSVGSLKAALKGLIRRENPRKAAPSRSRSEETGLTPDRKVLQRQPFTVDSLTRCALPDLDEDPSDRPTKIGFKGGFFDDAHSRDSGHSSGGSPDFRTAMRRRRRMVRQEEHIDDDNPFSYPKSEWKAHLDSWRVKREEEEVQIIEDEVQIIEDEVQILSSSPSLRPTASKNRFYNAARWLLKTLLLLFSCFLFFVLGFACFKLTTCRSHRDLDVDLAALSDDLNASLFGQSSAKADILAAVSDLRNGEKVIALLLLGWLGGGKTLTANVLARRFPVPSNVHYFAAPLHFAAAPSETLDDLALLIPRSCGFSAVVFDDVDNVPRDNLDYIGSFIASLKVNPASKGNGTLVVVTSNAAGAAINEKALQAAKTGSPLDVRLNEDSVPLAGKLRKHGVDVRIVPFLPLTRDDVRKCVRKEIEARGVAVPNEDDVNSVLEEINFFSDDFPIFSSTGCKKVAGIVDVLLGDNF